MKQALIDHVIKAVDELQPTSKSNTDPMLYRLYAAKVLSSHFDKVKEKALEELKTSGALTVDPESVAPGTEETVLNSDAFMLNLKKSKPRSTLSVAILENEMIGAGLTLERAKRVIASSYADGKPSSTYEVISKAGA